MLFKAYLEQVDIEIDAKQQEAKFKYESKFSNWNFYYSVQSLKEYHKEDSPISDKIVTLQLFLNLLLTIIVNVQVNLHRLKLHYNIHENHKIDHHPKAIYP